MDVAKVSAETKAYQPIPIIADFTNENGSDSLRETIEANYRQVKQEVLFLVSNEIDRIKATPNLAHLIKE
nr:conjugal transfer protein TraG [Porphyromonas uenonis]